MRNNSRSIAGDFIRQFTRVFALALAALAVCLGGCSLLMIHAAVPATSLEAESPDGRRRLGLVELPRFIDRNSRVELVDISAGARETVYESPDEGRPV